MAQNGWASNRPPRSLNLPAQTPFWISRSRDDRNEEINSQILSNIDRAHRPRATAPGDTSFPLSGGARPFMSGPCLLSCFRPQAAPPQPIADYHLTKAPIPWPCASVIGTIPWPCASLIIALVLNYLFVFFLSLGCLFRLHFALPRSSFLCLGRSNERYLFSLSRMPCLAMLFVCPCPDGE